MKGPKGEQSLTLMDIVNAKQTDEGIVIEPANDTQEARAAWGTTRALIDNMVTGVKAGFEKKLHDPGRRLSAPRCRARTSSCRSAFSHEVVYQTPKGITLAVPTPTEVDGHGHRQAAGRAGCGRHSRVIVSRSPTRARACVMWASTSPAKKARRSKERWRWLSALKGADRRKARVRKALKARAYGRPRLSRLPFGQEHLRPDHRRRDRAVRSLPLRRSTRTSRLRSRTARPPRPRQRSAS